MDPKKLSGIDPKLQEAYNRVMGTPTPSSSPASPTKNEINATQPSAELTNTQKPADNPAVNTPASSNPPAPSTPPPLPTLTPIESHKTTPANSQTANAHPAVGMVAKSGGNGIPPVVLVVAAVIFFLVYTLFFIKLFNVSVPFLP